MQCDGEPSRGYQEKRDRRLGSDLVLLIARSTISTHFPHFNVNPNHLARLTFHLTIWGLKALIPMPKAISDSL
jgi:hypothetical protein